ncbi:hypothetical protein U1Q18_002819 [Sarracenia purpurea var. burkii]
MPQAKKCSIKCCPKNLPFSQALPSFSLIQLTLFSIMTTPSLLHFLALILSFSYIFGSVDSVVPKNPKNFIKDSCKFTPYSDVCVRSLSPHAKTIQQNRHQLALTALTVSLAAIGSTKANLLKLTNIKGLKPTEYGALKDCLDQIGESVNQLSQSAREIERLGTVRGEEYTWHKNNVDTWNRDALKQMDTCLVGFSNKALDGKIKAVVAGQVFNVEQLINNAIVLFHYLSGIENQSQALFKED